MPATYQRVVIDKFGGPEVLEIAHDKIPEPGPEAARVKIIAAGLSGA
jgi:NADPH:quinone reductase